MVCMDCFGGRVSSLLPLRISTRIENKNIRYAAAESFLEQREKGRGSSQKKRAKVIENLRKRTVNQK